MLSGIIFLLAITGTVFGIHREAIRPKHGYHVHNFQIRPTSLPPLGYQNAMNLTMELEFQAGEYQFELDLRLITNLWNEKSKIITEMDADGNPTKTLPLFHRSYRGRGYVLNEQEGIDESGSVVVHFFHDGRFTVMLTTDGDVYFVDVDDQVHNFYPLHGADAGHGIHMSRLSHTVLGEEKKGEHLHDPVRSRVRQYLRIKPGARKLQQLIPFNDCFEGQAANQRAIRMGLVSDPAYYGLVTSQGGTPAYTSARDTQVTDSMISELNRASDVYSAQLRVWLLPGTLITGSAAAALPMATGSFARQPGSRSGACTQTDGSARLTTLRQWRQTVSDTNALWHLFTDCHPPPGTVGIAYIGVICHKTYGVGWTNYVSASSTWLTFAHEVGHNFGSPHSFDNGQGQTGGIMDYGDGYYPAPGNPPTANRAIAFNPLRKNDICGEIASSLASRSSSEIPPADCWTLYQTVPPTPTPAPTQPTPQPTPPPQPTPEPTAKPTTRTPSRNPTKKPTRFPTNPPTLRPTLKPTGNPTTTTTTLQPTLSPTETMRPTTATARPTTLSPTLKPTLKPTSNPTLKPTSFPSDAPATSRPTSSPTQPIVPQVTFSWEPTNPPRYTPCSPTCGTTRFQLLIYECVETTTTPNQPTTRRVVADTQCDGIFRPIPDPILCTSLPCTTIAATCGDGQVTGTEVCDTQSDSCCETGCERYKFTLRCLARNKVLDGAYMSCDNDAAHWSCYLYMFQGEYFMKTYAVPGYRFFYRPQWSAPLKHYGLLQNRFPTVTAVAGGRYGLVYVFNGLDFALVDYSDESKGKELEFGNVLTKFGVAQKFADCGSVTAADVIYLRWLILFCNQIYTFVDLVKLRGSRYVYPASWLFWSRLRPNTGVNAFYWDDRWRRYRLFRGPIQEAFLAAGLQISDNASATTGGIFDQGGVSLTSNVTCNDPECISCPNDPAVCVSCNHGFKVLVERCIRSRILIDMTFERNSRNDAVYSNGNGLLTATFVADHGGNPNAAMVFTGTTAVTVFSPELTAAPRGIGNFRISLFYKPSNVIERQRLVSIDNRFWIDFTPVDGLRMRMWVTYDNLTFDCFVERPLTLNEWNKVAIEFAGRQLITFVNGFDHLRAFQVLGGGDPLALQFQSVVVGASTGGVQGALDSFVVEEVPVSTSSSAVPSASTTESDTVVSLVLSIVGGVLGLCLVVGLVYFAVQRGYCDSCSDDKSDFNSTQQAFNAASRQNNIAVVREEDYSSTTGRSSVRMSQPAPPPRPPPIR